MSTFGYRLPCQCGQFVTVTKRQAGQKTNCQACGTTLTVPTMLELNQLENVELESKGTAAGPAGSGCLFSTFLFMGGMGALPAGVLFILSSLWFPRDDFNIPITIESVTVQAEEQIDSFDGPNLLSTWDGFDHGGLGEPEPPQFVVALRLSRRLWNVAAVIACISTIFVMLAAGIFLKDLVGRRK